MSKTSMHAVLTSLVLAIGLCQAVPALAQEAPEVGVGYQFFRIAEENFTLGFMADVAVPVSPALSVIGEFSWTSRSGEVEEIPGLTFDESATSFGGGIRFNRRMDMRTVYGQAVLGLERDSATDHFLGSSESQSASNMMIGLDGGVCFPVTPRVDGFVQGGIRRIFYEGQGETGVRIVGGLRIHLR